MNLYLQFLLVWGGLLALPLIGCTTTAYKPLVDMRGVDPADFRQDMAECRTYAAQRVPYNGDAVSQGSFGELAYIPQYGGVFPSKETIRHEKLIIRRCLRGRGYNVLD